MTLNDVIARLRFKQENITAKLPPEYFAECAEYLESFRDTLNDIIQRMKEISDDKL